VSELPETQYARTADGAYIAYQVLGEGQPDLLLLGNLPSHLELAWEIPRFARVFRGLASFRRLIRFDERGTGLSDPLSQAEQPSLEMRAKEMLAVLDAVGSERTAVVANSVGGLLAIVFAATYPARTAALVLDGCYARLTRDSDYPWGIPRETMDRAIAFLVSSPELSGEENLKYTAPYTFQHDPEFKSQYFRYVRQHTSPGQRVPMAEMSMLSDLRPLLPSIQAPTLVLYRSGDRFAGRPHAVYLAEHIPGAKLVELPGEDNLMFVGDTGAVVSEIEEFLTGARRPPDTDRVLATVLFTDIVGSTERATTLGDRRWRDLLDSHDWAVRRQLERFGGREVNTSGDGFVATFDGPGRAVQCACAIRDAVKALDLEVRTGLHTGEIERRGDDVAGIAVHLAQRVSALADAGEVLVSRTVTDLVVGSGLRFDDRGEHTLKGVPGTWRLYSVVT
jgi:class 3 adenylate cyclase/alpha-beta hydrolase superfamily lysophospholipase